MMIFCGNAIVEERYFEGDWGTELRGFSDSLTLQTFAIFLSSVTRQGFEAINLPSVSSASGSVGVGVVGSLSASATGNLQSGDVVGVVADLELSVANLYATSGVVSAEVSFAANSVCELLLTAVNQLHEVIESDAVASEIMSAQNELVGSLTEIVRAGLLGQLSNSIADQMTLGISAEIAFSAGKHYIESFALAVLSQLELAGVSGRTFNVLRVLGEAFKQALMSIESLTQGDMIDETLRDSDLTDETFLP
jgi:hypothetical protein